MHHKEIEIMAVCTYIYNTALPLSILYDYLYIHKLSTYVTGLLPDSYKESFKLESPFNQSGDFRPSFIMPSKDNVVMESKKMPENLRVCSLPGCKLSERDDLILKKCSGCKSGLFKENV